MASDTLQNLLGFVPITGTVEQSLDKRNRIQLLKEHREGLGNDFVIMQSERGNLVAIPNLQFVKLIQETEQYPQSTVGYYDYLHFISGCSEVGIKCDDQGRIVLSDRIKTAGNLSLKVVLRGAVKFLEIWDPAELAAFELDPEGYNKERRAKFQQARKRMVEGV